MKLLRFAGIFAALFSHALFSHTPLPATTEPYHWTGFYGGLNIGALKHSLNMTDNMATTFNATIQQIGNPELTGGFQLGYRRSLELALASGLYGLEFTGNFSDATFKSNYGSPYALYQLDAENQLKNNFLLQLIGV